MDKSSFFDQQARAAEGRHEALKWLAGRLRWEHRLSELRPHSEPKAAAKQAA